MIKNYLKVAWRNLSISPFQTFIKVFGLSIGIASVMLILFHIKDELSFDQAFSKSDRIFRVTNENLGEGARHWAATPPPMGPEIQQQLPEVESAVRFHRPSAYQLLSHTSKSGDTRKFEERGGFIVDPGAVEMFDLEFVRGDATTALSEMNSIVLTEEMALKYFGNEDPLGKVIMDNIARIPLKVSGVIAKFPFQTHLKFDYLLSMPTISNYQDQGALSSRGWSGFYTYIQLREDVPLISMTSKMEKFMVQFYGPHGETPSETLAARKLRLQPITDIHLYSKLEKEMYPNSDITYVYIFAFVALFILLLAAVNFINISTTQSFGRIKEIGVRKVVGAKRKQLIQQFLMDSLLVTFLSMIVALVIFGSAIPYYDDLTSKPFYQENIFTLSNFGILLLMLISIGILAGLYPAVFVSRFHLVSSLNSKRNSGPRIQIVRNSLIVFQFVISVFMIVGTVIIYNQMNLFHHKNLGFDKEQVLAITMHREMWENYGALKAKLLENPAIENFSTTTNIPGNRFGSYFLTPLGNTQKVTEGFDARLMLSDEKFLSTLDIPIKEGRDFFRQEPNTGNKECIINEAAAKLFGSNNPVGKRVAIGRDTANIVGVVRDFNFASLHSPIEPLVIQYNPYAGGHLLIKVQENQLPRTIAYMEKSVESIAPSSTFSYSFVDDRLDGLYDAENRMSKVFNVFALLSLLISCLGLYSLSAYMASIRIKEIGIRKVLGSSKMDIIGILSKDFLRLVCAAILIATPFTYFTMERWLQDFAYRIEMQWWMFGLAGVLVLFIAIVTLSYQGIKSANANPIESLRTE
ncbi:ABC transporter permease [Ulvibacterium sp.]|uniref:ABC transporter permease n=1 Tax=Ulvibacterium sp. TaxID=2665914 RepID=UPI003BAB719E